MVASALAQAFDVAGPMTDAQYKAAKAANMMPIRYLWSGSKGMTLAECGIAAKYEIPVGLVFEGRGDQPSNFNQAQAKIDAALIIHLLGLLDVPKNVCIYCCSDDFDASDTQIKNNIVPYFVVLAPLIRAAGYRVGAYGNGAACAALLDAKVIDLAWLWGVRESNGSPAFLASNRWAIHQHQPSTLFGLSVDTDDIKGDCGAWVPDKDNTPPVVAPPAPASTVTPFASLKEAQTALKAKGLYAGTPDDNFGQMTGTGLAIVVAAYKPPPVT